MVEVRNWEIENARTTLLTFGFKYSELIPIVVKYEKLLNQVYQLQVARGDKINGDA
jgi:hypothetical protein